MILSWLSVADNQINKSYVTLSASTSVVIIGTGYKPWTVMAQNLH